MQHGFHITFDRRGHGPLHLNGASWDDTTARMLRVLAPWNLVAACVVHDHLHTLLLVDRETAGRASQALECSLGWSLRPTSSEAGTWWNPPRFTPIRDARHLTDTVRYILPNGVASVDDAVSLLSWRWSTIWEALGLRFTGFELCRDVPDTSRSATAALVFGDRKWQPTPAPFIHEPEEPVAHLIQVAKAATGFCLERPFTRKIASRSTRDVAIALARSRGWHPSAIAAALSISIDTVERATVLDPLDPRFLAARSLLTETAYLGSLAVAPPGPGRLHGRR